MQPRDPKGNLVDPSWVRRHFGIETRAFDFDLSLDRKRTRAEGGIYDIDLTDCACHRALLDADLSGRDIGTVIHATVTQGELHFQNHLGELRERLGLAPTVNLLHLDLGCAAPAQALKTAQAHLLAEPDAPVLFVASQCVSAATSGREVINRYVWHPDPWAWLTPSIFGDAAGALVLGHNSPGARFLRVWQSSVNHTRLVYYPIGGLDRPIDTDNAEQALFLSNPLAVSQNFVPVMQQLHAQLVNDWERHVRPQTGQSFDHDRIARWYIHQANALKVGETITTLGLPSERVPLNVPFLGNTSAASTLLLLDDDRRHGRVAPGDTVVFFWVGAGNGGTQMGYAVAQL